MTAQPAQYAGESADDALIIAAVERANVLCVHPTADTTRDIGRAVLAAERARTASATDLSKRLRAEANSPHPSCVNKSDLRAAADEIDRYYGGMLAWKATAEAKDAALAAIQPAAASESVESFALGELLRKWAGIDAFDPNTDEYKAIIAYIHEWHAANKPAAPAAATELQSIEQYRMQMAAISTASLGYWKEGDNIHPDYDTVPLRDVVKLYAKYAELHTIVHGTVAPAASLAASAALTPHGTDIEQMLDADEASAAQPAVQLTPEQIEQLARKHAAWISKGLVFGVHFYAESLANFVNAIGQIAAAPTTKEG